jgi:hypothetical protein
MLNIAVTRPVKFPVARGHLLPGGCLPRNFNPKKPYSKKENGNSNGNGKIERDYENEIQNKLERLQQLQQEQHKLEQSINRYKNTRAPQ